MRNLTEDEHQDLLCYLEEIMSLALKSKKGRWYDSFMKSDYMKLVNDTFSELVSNDAYEEIN